MKKFTLIVLMAVLVSGCEAGGGPTASTSSILESQPILGIDPSPTPSPTPSPSVTATSTWGGFSGGGDQANPYQVTTAEDVTHIGDFPSAYFELTGNIDMSGTTFTPIPTFSGVIEGHLFKLYNFTIAATGANSAAFAITLTGSIDKLYMGNVSITSATQFAAAYAVNLQGNITNCQVLSGTLTSPQGGNGQNSGVGNVFYVNLVSGALSNSQASVTFNGHIITNGI